MHQKFNMQEIVAALYFVFVFYFYSISISIQYKFLFYSNEHFISRNSIAFFEKILFFKIFFYSFIAHIFNQTYNVCIHIYKFVNDKLFY